MRENVVEYHSTIRRSANIAASILTVFFITAASEVCANDMVAESPFRIPKVNSHINLDGILDEYFWQNALVMELNYEVQPGENIPALVRTELLLAYDENNLYAAFRAYDPDPSQIRARICDRDNISGDDWVALNFDTFNDERRSYLFLVNPYGVQNDCIESQEGDGSWDAIWDSNGRITDEGYVVEMAIPFSSLSFQRTDGDQIWGIDAIRSYPRDVDHRCGLISRDRNNNCYWCQFWKLIGFAGATPGNNIEIDPTISGIYSQERQNETSGSFIDDTKDVNVGATTQWGFTPNLMLSATVNPDFSQVEADARQLDINTQFAISYPEKRPFFLEGSDFFITRFTAVYTRTIADPAWGIKLTGKEGPNVIGFFSSQDKITNLLFPASEGSDDESLNQRNTGTAFRYRRDIGKSTNLGLLITDREGEEYHNRLAGFDGNLRISLRDRIRFQLLGSRTQYPAGTADEYDQPLGEFQGFAGDFYYFHETRSLDWYAMHREVEPEFRADLGFMTQANYRYTDVGWGHTWQRDPGHWWHMLNFGSCVEYEDDFDTNLIYKRFAWWFNYAGPMQSSLDASGGLGKKVYDGSEFHVKDVFIDISTRPTGTLHCYLGCGLGDAIDYENTRQGSHIELSPEIEYRFGAHLTIWLDHTFERLNVAEGRLYDANISRVKFVYQFTKRTFVRTITQYVNYNRNISLYEDNDVIAHEQDFLNQILFAYKINPQTVFFLGYSDNYSGDENVSVIQTNRAVFAKIGYAWVL